MVNVNSDLWESAEKFASVIGIKPDIMFDLLDASDDWTFIAKVHFIIESSLKKMLFEHLEKADIEKEIFEFPFKAVLKLCEKLKLIDNDLPAVVTYIQGLRNYLIHNSNNLHFSFETHFKIEKNEKIYFSIFHPYLADEVKITGKSIPRKQFMIENPRVAIYFALMNLLGVGHINLERIAFKKKQEELARLKSELPLMLLREIINKQAGSQLPQIGPK